MRIVDLKVLDHYRIDLTFDDGTRGTVDLSDLVGKGVFSAWSDYQNFRDVSIGSGGELVWASGQDLCADALYLKSAGKRPEDLFESLSPEAASA